jgi:hypothetical protein
VVTIGAGASEPANSATQAAAGAGNTIIEGGSGGDTPLPVTTIVAFRARAGGVTSSAWRSRRRVTGPGSGEFTDNVMYVTGPVRSLSVDGDTAVLRGVATVTGIGAGQRQPFTVRVTEGGPGTTLVLTVSGLTLPWGSSRRPFHGWVKRLDSVSALGAAAPFADGDVVLEHSHGGPPGDRGPNPRRRPPLPHGGRAPKGSGRTAYDVQLQPAQLSRTAPAPRADRARVRS